MYEVRMMPGQEPYTPAQHNRLRRLFREACQVQEVVDLDELERAAAAEWLTERGQQESGCRSWLFEFQDTDEAEGEDSE